LLVQRNGDSGSPRLTAVDEALSDVVEIAELAVTIRVLSALGHLGVGLQRVAEAMQQTQHRARRHVEATAHELFGQVGRGLRRPTQQRHRSATGLGMDQPVERFE